MVQERDKRVVAIETMVAEAIESMEVGTRKAKLRKALTLIEVLLEENEYNFDANYLAGFVWYHLNDDEGSAQRVMDAFARALEQEPSSSFARMYLAHQLFDVGRYAEALKEFDAIRLEKFVEIDQVWRILKIRELMVCCRLYLNPREVSESDVDALCRDVASGDVFAAEPTELIACLGELAQSAATFQIARRLTMIAVGRLRGAPATAVALRRGLLDDAEQAVMTR